MRPKLVITIFSLLSLWLAPTPTAEAHPASGIVVDRTGNIYFSDLETIWKLDTDRKLTVFRSGVRGRHVHELSIDEQDNIYGADVSYNPSTKGWIGDVWKMTPSGKFTYLLAPTEHPSRGWSIWRDRAANMYCIDQNNHTKTETLLLRRTPEGAVTTLAGGAYGHADGKGSLAKFGSVGGIAFGPDGSLYLSDGSFIRKVTLDGNVTTLATDLTRSSGDDSPTLFGGSYGSLAGLAVDSDGTVYVADAGNRRLLKIITDGKVEVILRSEPPYFPTGVTTAAGNPYVLEVGFTLPSAWSGPRIRKIGLDGRSTILTTVGAGGPAGGLRSAFATRAGVAAESTLAFFYNERRVRYTIGFVSVAILTMGALIWRRRKKARA